VARFPLDAASISRNAEPVPRADGGPAALAGVVLGHLVELYDFAVFAASASVLALVVTPAQGGLTSVFLVLAAALFVRPLGAVLVGRIADLSGRRIPFLAMTVLMLVSTTSVGLLPSAATAGVAAAIGLIALRLLQAFSVGGETSTSVSYLSELAPAGRRGVYGGVHLAASAVGMALGIGVVLVVQTVLTRAQVLAWGWRVPFLLALPLGLVTFALRRRLLESRAFALARPRTPDGAGTDPGAPAGDAQPSLLRRQPRTILAGGLLGGAFTVTVNLWFVVVPGYLLATRRASPAAVLGAAVTGLLVCAALAPVVGRLSDRVGRPVVLVAACVLLSVAWPTLLTDALADPAPVSLVLAAVVAGVALSGFVLASHLPEVFATGDRATGVGLTFGVGGAVLGGVAPLLAAWLNGRQWEGAVVVYPVVCAALAAVALAWSTLQPDDGIPAAAASAPLLTVPSMSPVPE
jgi:MHS family proline/betaine transporter-like MFS transporter